MCEEKLSFCRSVNVENSKKSGKELKKQLSGGFLEGGDGGVWVSGVVEDGVGEGI